MLQSGYYGAGVVWGAETQRDPAWMSRNLAELLRWWKQGKLKPPIAKTFPLAEAGAALNALLSPLRRKGGAGSVVRKSEAPSAAKLTSADDASL